LPKTFFPTPWFLLAHLTPEVLSIVLPFSICLPGASIVSVTGYL
jgi:hypothetical protein